MRKILAGFVLALVLGIPAVYFGVPWWANQKAQRELDATLESVRRAGGTATRGATHYDLWTRTLKVSNLFLQSGDAAKSSLKIGQLTATGLAAGNGPRFSADHVDVTDAEVSGLQLGPSSPVQSYTIPKLTAEKLVGPTVITPKPATSIAGAEDVLTALNVFAALSASKVNIPTMKAVTAAPSTRSPAPGEPAEYTISDIAIDTIDSGRVRSMTIARIDLQARIPDAGTLSSNIEKIEINDFDPTPMVAALRSEQAKDDSFHRIYRRVTTGPYTIKMASTPLMSVSGLLVDEVSIRPRNLLDPALLTFAETLRSQQQPALSPADTAAFFDKIANVYEAIKVGRLEMQGFSLDVGGQTPTKIGVVKLTSLEAGKIAELAIENLDVAPPSGPPTTLGRFAFKRIDFVKLMRLMAQLGTNPSPGLEQGLGLLTTLEAIELRDFKGVERATMQPLQIATLDLSWGRFIGSIPSQIRAATKLTATVDPNGNDPNLRYLVDAGIKDVTLDFDFGAAWSEPTRTIALSPVTATVANVVGLSAQANIANVPASIFSPNPLMFGMAAAQTDAGPLQITLRDLGITNLIAAQLARDQGTTPDVMRTRLVEMVQMFSMASPELDTIGTALTQLIEKRDTTLTVTLTPKARVNLLQAAEIARTDPLLFLSQFKVEAKTER